MNLANSLTLVISSCEAYSDLWENRILLLDGNWPGIEVKTVIVTDKIHSGGLKNVTILSSGAI